MNGASSGPLPALSELDKGENDSDLGADPALVALSWDLLCLQWSSVVSRKNLSKRRERKLLCHPFLPKAVLFLPLDMLRELSGKVCVLEVNLEKVRKLCIWRELSKVKSIKGTIKEVASDLELKGRSTFRFVCFNA